MKRFSWRAVALAAVLGATIVAGSAQAVPVFGTLVHYMSGSNQKGVSTANPLPVQVLSAGGATTALVCTTGTNVALSTASEEVFAANTSRREVTITNNDASIAIKVCRKTAAADSGCLRVPGGSSWHDQVVEGYINQTSINAIAESGTPAISSESCQ